METLESMIYDASKPFTRDEFERTIKEWSSPEAMTERQRQEQAYWDSITQTPEMQKVLADYANQHHLNYEK